MQNKRLRFIRWLECTVFPAGLVDLAWDARNAAIEMGQKAWSENPRTQMFAIEDLKNFTEAFSRRHRMRRF